MILVTGGTGLVGAHLLYQLSLDDIPIVAIHRKSSNLDTVKRIFSYYTNNYEVLFNKNMGVGTEFDINTQAGTPISIIQQEMITTSRYRQTKAARLTASVS